MYLFIEIPASITLNGTLQSWYSRTIHRESECIFTATEIEIRTFMKRKERLQQIAALSIISLT